MCHHEKGLSLQIFDEYQICFPYIQLKVGLFVSYLKKCRNFLPCQHTKNRLSSFRQALSTTYALQLPFLWQNSCVASCYVMHHAMFSILLNSTVPISFQWCTTSLGFKTFDQSINLHQPSAYSPTPKHQIFWLFIPRTLACTCTWTSVLFLMIRWNKLGLYFNIIMIFICMEAQ